MHEFVSKVKGASYKKGDIIFSEGEASNNCMYFVLSGSLLVTKNINSELINLRHLLPENFFGEIALLLPETKRTATVTVESDTARIAYFDFVTFKEIINNTKFISLLFKDILTIYKDVIERIVKIPNLKEINIKDDFEILKQTRKNIRDILEYIKIQETFFYNIGKVFIREGEASKDIIYFILDGTAKISKTIYNKEIDIAYLNSGNMLGEDCLLENEKRFYTAKMGETGHVAILDKETFLKTCSIVPDLFMNIFKQQVFNLYKLEELYFSLAYKK